MTDVAGPWEDFAAPDADTAPAPVSDAPKTPPVAPVVRLAMPGSAAPVSDDAGPWADFGAGVAAADTSKLPIAPTAHNEVGHAFGDEMPAQVSHKMSPADEATYSNCGFLDDRALYS